MFQQNNQTHFITACGQKPTNMEKYIQTNDNGQQFIQVQAQAKQFDNTSIRVPMAASMHDEIIVTYFIWGHTFELTWQFGEMKYEPTTKQVQDLYNMLEQYSTH